MRKRHLLDLAAEVSGLPPKAALKTHGWRTHQRRADLDLREHGLERVSVLLLHH